MKHLAALLAAVVAALVLCVSAQAAEPGECEPRAECFGLESVDVSLSTTQAGAHPDVDLGFEVKQDPETPPNLFGLRDSYATTRDITIELPPGLIGDPNVLGLPQQCTTQELFEAVESKGGCPNGSQVGLTRIYAYGLKLALYEPIYMMVPPGGETVARLGFAAGTFPTFVDFEVRSEDDYGLVAKIEAASSVASLVKAETTIWGVPADPKHDTERLTPAEAIEGAQGSPPRPPGSRPLAFMTNPTSCGTGEEVRVKATSWPLPNRVSEVKMTLPPITGCNKLVFGPSLSARPTSAKAGSQTGLDLTIALPAADGVDVLEPSHMRELRITFPQGMSLAPGAVDGLEACSAEQVKLGKRENAQCPDGAKLGSTEFDIPVLERRMKGALYLRTPEPGNLYRIWVVADDLGAHVKLPGELELDPVTGQITSIVLNIPQAPVREVKLQIKSGFRAPLSNPNACGTYFTHWEFVPWSGNPPVFGDAPMQIDEGCDTGGFSPRLSAGTTNPAAGQPSPFVFTLTREDGEQNLAALNVTLPPGLVAKFGGIPLCEGAQAQSGNCPAASQIGKVRAAVGPGPAPLWVPQPGKDLTAVYLGGPYKGAPLSIIAAVPAQAGPFDFGVVVVRSAIQVNPRTAIPTVISDPFPQILEGALLPYRTIHVAIDRPNFTQNPTNCSEFSVSSSVISEEGQVAHPSSRFRAGGCGALEFRPRLSMRLRGGTGRGGHPALRATLRPRPGDANVSDTVVRLPRSAFLDQAHIRTVCTRVQFAADSCPAGAIYGHAVAQTPLLEKPLEGPVYLRSSDHLLPDLVADLHGLVDVEAVGRVDSIGGGIRASFEDIPDAPLTKVLIAMQGGKKGLIINSRNLCAAPSRALAEFRGQNGRLHTARPRMEASCAKGSRPKQRRHSLQHNSTGRNR